MAGLRGIGPRSSARPRVFPYAAYRPPAAAGNPCIVRGSGRHPGLLADGGYTDRCNSAPSARPGGIEADAERYRGLVARSRRTHRPARPRSCNGWREPQDVHDVLGHDRWPPPTVRADG
ncbi:hypothetical protein ACFPN0_02465 [Kitasatospora cinereorecta]